MDQVLHSKTTEEKDKFMGFVQCPMYKTTVTKGKGFKLLVTLENKKHRRVLENNLINNKIYRYI